MWWQREAKKAASVELQADRTLQINKRRKKEYASLHATAVPLVSTIEYLLDREQIPTPNVLEIGIIPTSHHFLQRSEKGVIDSWKYSREVALEKARDAAKWHANVPPIKYLADRHPEWSFVAISPDELDEEQKEQLLGTHADICMTKLGPERTSGINPEDVWDTEHFRGTGVGRKYPFLLERFKGEQPNIIFGRHVFDRKADNLYPATELTTVAAMLLKKGGYFLSHVYGSTRTDSRVPWPVRVPFDAMKSMSLAYVVSYMLKDREWPDYVFVWKKNGDFQRDEPSSADTKTPN